MLDLPPRDHNLPPAFDEASRAELEQKVDEFLKATKAWLDLEAITTDQEAGTITDQIDGLRGLYKRVEEERKAAKKPHDDAGKLVQAAYTPLADKLKKAADKLKVKIGVFLDEKAKKEAEEQERRIREAEAAAREAEAAAAAALASNDVGAQVDAEANLKAAEDLQKKASRKTNTQAKSATGAGRTLSRRVTREAEITNINQLFMALRDDPVIQATLLNRANAIVRESGYDHERAPLPGIKIVEKASVA